VNFHWLKQGVDRLAELTIRSGRAEPGRGMVARFMLRYVLLAATSFVILAVSRESLYGLFAGLFLPVSAIFCEAAYEAYVVAGRREHSS